MAGMCCIDVLNASTNNSCEIMGFAMHKLTVVFLLLCSSSVNSSTIPPKTHPNVPVCDNQKVKSEASVGFRVQNALSESASRVSQPPPRIPNGIRKFS